MLFWLNFIQALPSVHLTEIPSVQLQPKQQQTTAINPTFPIINQPTLAQVNGGLVFPGIIVMFVILLILSLFAYTRVYVVTPNNEAFVRTGGLFTKKKSVILYGGCIVLPGFHQLTRVPLREISIDVERTGKLAVRTKDYLRADIRVTFYVCINASEDDVLTSAARLSQNGTRITPEDIKNALEKRADDAIRAAAKTKDLAEIDSDKLGFAQEVLNLVGTDLKKVGLTLNNIAISEILESVTYDPDNFFDAQGVRLRTEIIQRSVQQKREVELAAQVTIEQKELDAQKRSLQIAQEQESAKLSQRLQVEALKAQREREIQESKDTEAATVRRTKILQEKSVEEEEIRRKLSLQESQIQADIALEERNKQLKVAKSLQQQEAEIAEILRQQSVESGKLKAQVQIAESERIARLAQEDVAIAIANKKRESLVAQAEQAKAEESVKTASEVEKAERTKRLSLIAAEREAQERSISDRNVVEIDAFRRRRQAEISQEAAELEAEAIRVLADANRDKALADAEGIQARIAAENTISNANLTAKIITTIWPELADKLPEILSSLAPQPGVLGDTRIYSFPGANGSSGSQDINKLLLSTSGLSLINTLLDEGKLGELIGQVSQLVRSNNHVVTPILNQPDQENN
ncbi:MULTISPECIES: flotillin family protein [unclassified Anabaena]|uniref:flotillin family protein n=1 Tax=unclassified Anabaena TaxID=2619674 RepID=UPI001446D9B1|nr:MULTISPECIES: flotillin family protein [unclassified Anabaena]MTJ07046.1 flotillin family protein [Anabaena sp. UHCC 0204]MTJ52040.1 flotillin family protein [Anabaena sp. UHCC 0253]